MAQNTADKPWHKIHLWQIQVLRDAAWVGAAIGLLYVGYLLRTVTVPILLALMLAYLFEPLVRRLTRTKRMTRQGVATIIIVSAIAFVVIPVTFGVAFGVVQGVGFLREATQNSLRVATFIRESPAPPAFEEHEALTEFLSKQPETSQEAYNGLSNDSWRRLTVGLSRNIDTQSEEVRNLITWVQDHSKQILSTTIGSGAEALGVIAGALVSFGVLGFQAFIVAFFFFFFSTGYDNVLTFLARFIHRKNKSRTLELIGKMDRVVAGFVRGRLTIAAIQCTVFSIGYLVIGVPAAVVLGIAVGLLSIVPYMALIGIPTSILLLWLDPPGGFRGEWWWIIGAPVVFYFAAQAIDDYVLTPMIQGKQTGLDAPMVLFASLAGGILAGVYGLLLAIPVAACLKIVITEVIWPRVRAWTEGRAEDPLPGSAKAPSA